MHTSVITKGRDISAWAQSAHTAQCTNVSKQAAQRAHDLTSKPSQAGVFPPRPEPSSLGPGLRSPRRQGEGERIATCAPAATRATVSGSHGAIPTAAEVGGRCTLRAGTVALGLVHATMVYSAPGLGACTMAVRLAPLGAWRTTGTWLWLGVGVG